MAPIKRARSPREAVATRVLKFGVKRTRRQRRIAREAYKEWRRPPKDARSELENLKRLDAEDRFLHAKKAAKRVPKKYLKLARKIAGKRRNA